MSKYFRHNITTIVSVFDNDVSADKFKSDKKRIGLYFPKLEVNVYFSVFGNEITAVNRGKIKMHDVLLRNNQWYYVSVLKNNANELNSSKSYMTGTDLAKLIGEMEAEEFRLENGKPFEQVNPAPDTKIK